MKLCKDCKFYKSIQPSGPLDGTPWSWMTPEVDACGVQGHLSPVDGSPLYRRCDFMRKDGPCGAEGKLFVPKGELREP